MSSRREGKPVNSITARRYLSPIYYAENGDIKPSNVTVIPPATRRRIVFGWYGGKFNHLDWLLPLLPTAHHYCEPFAGSAAVLLNRHPSPVETYNDIDGEVVTFFRVLRDASESLIRAITLTPFSRTELFLALHGKTDGITDLERGAFTFELDKLERVSLKLRR